MTKICNRCKIEKSLIEFFKAKDNKTDGHYSICKICKQTATLGQRAKKREEYNDYMRKYRHTHPKKYEDARKKCLKQRYNLTLEQYDQMLKDQSGVCKICKSTNKKDKKLVVDHNHQTGAVRGLLCYRCNIAIAIMDNPDLFIIATNYLK